MKKEKTPWELLSLETSRDSSLSSMIKLSQLDSGFIKQIYDPKLFSSTRFKQDYTKQDTSIKKNTAFFSSKPLLKIESGYIGYNWTYRSGGDSAFIENNISQHVISGSFNAVLAQILPLRITYFERQSNSAFLKDFRDIRVDVDVQKYSQRRLQRAIQQYKNIPDNLSDPGLTHSLKTAALKTDLYKRLLNHPKIITQLIQSRETLARRDFADTALAYQDSLIQKADQFIQLFDSLHLMGEKYQYLYDSLLQVYRQTEKKIERIKQLLSSKSFSPADAAQLADLYGHDKKYVHQAEKILNGIKLLSLGRTLPDMSSLTLKNVNVNGINVEYNKDNLYMALAAGIVDFRLRDFLYSHEKTVKQYLYSARIGYGTREKDHLILTYFRGKKQLFTGSPQNPSGNIQGVSLAAQYYILKRTKVYGEIAQSGVPYTAASNFSEKNGIDFNDHSQRAYSAGFTTLLLRGQTRIEGQYQHTGLNYQAFNSFQSNATANSWSVRMEQYLWRRQLVLQAAARKNDFDNPLVLQRYNASTVFKSLIVTFRKIKWPYISLGYLPSSQLSIVGNLVYENHYQTISGVISHQYKIGSSVASSALSFSRFYNDSKDSGFVYFNSKNIFWNQSIAFNLFTTTMSVSSMNSSQYQLYVFEEGLSATFFGKVKAGFAIKINNLNKSTTKVGFNADTRINLRKIGELNLRMEQNYLPSLQTGLYQYEMYNLGLIKYFN